MGRKTSDKKQESKPQEKARKTGKRTGIQPLEGTDYGDGIVLGKTEGYKRVKERKKSSELFEGNRRKVSLRNFFGRLEEEGEITVSFLKKFVKEHGEDTDLIQRRLNWFSLGRYDKHNWHLTVRQGNGKPLQDKVLFHRVETDF